MKKVFSLFVVMAFIFSTAVAQDAGVKEQPKKVKEPEITFENIVHDYGSIYQGDNGTCQFVFKNTGKADLILTNCRASCGCTVPEWPKDPIAPGKKATIKVTYNTQRVGPFNKTVTVESNASNDKVVLSIKGNVAPKPTEAAPNNSNSPVKVGSDN